MKENVQLFADFKRKETKLVHEIMSIATNCLYSLGLLLHTQSSPLLMCLVPVLKLYYCHKGERGKVLG